MDDWYHDFEDHSEDQLNDYLKRPYENEDVSWADAPEEEEEPGFGEVEPPDVALLSKNLVPYDGARPGNLMARPWICPNPECLQLYIGSHNYICDLQTYMCKKCKTRNPTAYDWTLTRCIVNGIPLNFSEVYDQGRTKFCVLFAFMALCDIMRRIRGAKYGCDEGCFLDYEEMHNHFRRLADCNIGGQSDLVVGFQRAIGPQRHVNIELLLQAAVHHGVPYKLDTRHTYERHNVRSKRRIDESFVIHPTLNVTGWFRVCGQDVEKISRLLAAGIPLLGVVRQGKRFRRLAADQIYRGPRGSCIKHAVVLHGSGLATPQGEITKLEKSTEVVNSGIPTLQEVFFNCRNSYGKMYHSGIEEDGGADFCVWASDLDGDVYGIQLADHD